jgi:hypothetical protein
MQIKVTGVIDGDYIYLEDVKTGRRIAMIPLNKDRDDRFRTEQNRSRAFDDAFHIQNCVNMEGENDE